MEGAAGASLLPAAAVEQYRGYQLRVVGHRLMAAARQPDMARGRQPAAGSTRLTREQNPVARAPGDSDRGAQLVSAGKGIAAGARQRGLEARGVEKRVERLQRHA